MDCIANIEELRGIYGVLPPGAMAPRLVLPELHRHHLAYIRLSPFVVIASANARGEPDVSPRGDRPGFVAAPDANTLVVPDRPGNKKLVTLTNILANPAVALIFLVPGRIESLRVNGTASITADPAVLTPLAVDGKPPQSALAIHVTSAWFHCGRALLRSQLWEPDAQALPGVLPPLGKMIADQIAGIDAGDAEARLARANAQLWG
jgi:uncharacterized protein